MSVAPTLARVIGPEYSAWSSIFGTETHRLDTERAPLPAPGLLFGSMLMRRALFLKVDLFDEARHIGEFIDWQLRADELGLRKEIVPIVALRRLIHGENTTARPASDRGQYLTVLRMALDRRRGAGQP